MALIVQKFGGSSVADPEKIKHVAQRVLQTQAEGHQVCVVVSAMGDTTDELIDLADSISARRASREMDMLLTAGERISMSLLAMAIQEQGGKAKSFTGFQAGGTRGRQLQEGATSLHIYGTDVPIRAEVITAESLSAHADSDGLINWIRQAPTPPKMVFAVHGEPPSSDRLRYRISHELGFNARAAVDMETIDLANPE